MAKLLLGLGLLPTALGALVAALKTMGDVAAQPGRTLPFLLGFGAYLLLHFYLWRPARLYVLGHELTHAGAAWLSGARILGFFVGSKGGHVDLSHSNALISLAPYIVPLFASLIVGFYKLALWWSPPAPGQGPYRFWLFLFAMGLALSFHWTQTAEALWGARQPDIKQAGGTVFSVSVIALGNGLILIALLKCLFPSVVHLKGSFLMTWTFTKWVWTGAFLFGERFWRW